MEGAMEDEAREGGDRLDIISTASWLRMEMCQTSRWQDGGVPQAELSTSAKGHLADRILYL
jgi:hypothetical protein